MTKLPQCQSHIYSLHFHKSFEEFRDKLLLNFDLFLPLLQLKGSQEPKAKKSRRSQMVEPKEEASVSLFVNNPTVNI